MAIRENQEIFGRRRRGRVGLWILVTGVAAVLAVGLYVYDRRQTDRIATLQAELDRLRGTVGGEKAARESMREVASVQLRLTNGQITGVRNQLRSLEARLRKIEATGDQPASESGLARDVAQVREEITQLARKLAAIEERLSTPAPPKRDAAAPGESSPTRDEPRRTAPTPPASPE